MLKKTIGLILIMVMLLMPVASYADSIEAGRDCTVTITSAEGVKVMPGMNFKIYKVAKLHRNEVYELEAGFDSLGVSFSYDNMDKWSSYADKIAEYITNNGLEPIDAAVVDSNGTAKLPNALSKLSTGVYMIMADTVDVKDSDGKDKEYTVHPYLLSLPQCVNGEYIYDVTSYPKSGEYYEPKEEKKLPQTGLLWWPCLALTLAGLFFIVIGLALRKRSMYEK